MEKCNFLIKLGHMLLCIMSEFMDF